MSLLLLALAPAVERGLLFAGGPATSSSYRLTRNAVNQGGQPKADPAPVVYQMNGSLGENSGGTLTGATRNVSDGVMKIYFYPGRIDDIGAAPGVAAGEMNLTWTAPGADGNLLTASKYLVKYSTFPAAITDQAYFNDVATLFAVASPNGPGSAESITLTGLQPGTTYYVAIEARDADENQGDLSNTPSSWARAAILSVDIQNMNGDPNVYSFGSMTMSSAAVSTATIRVTNTGTTAATWSLRAATATAGSPWQLTTGARGTDVFRLSAAFHGVAPSSSSFSSGGSEDRLTPSDAASSGTAYTIDGSSTGVNVPIGQWRQIWLLMETPLATSTTDQQDVQVTVTANP